MQAPTNGFFYVLDRTTGKLLSAKPFVKVTWATGIDMKTGRPIENPGARYHGRGSVRDVAEHRRRLKLAAAILQSQDRPGLHPDDPARHDHRRQGLDLSKEQLPVHPANVNAGMGVTGSYSARLQGSGLVPARLGSRHPNGAVEREAAGRLAGRNDERPPAGSSSRAGSTIASTPSDAGSGKLLWSYDTRSPVVAPPISYAVGGSNMSR